MRVHTNWCVRRFLQPSDQQPAPLDKCCTPFGANSYVGVSLARHGAKPNLYRVAQPFFAFHQEEGSAKRGESSAKRGAMQRVAGVSPLPAQMGGAEVS